MKSIFRFTVLSILICTFSCKKNNPLNTTNILDSSLNIFNKGVKSVDSLVIDRTFEYFENRASTADSLNRIKIELHIRNLETKFPEYKTVEHWFKSNPKELFNLEGNFYKIHKNTIQNGKSVTRTSMIEASENGTFMYFFETKERFFILELQVFEFKVNCINVRCIYDGIGDEPMYDYIYDDNGELIKEIHQGEVNTSLYEDNGNLYFEYEKEDEGKERINSIDLGEVLNL